MVFIGLDRESRTRHIHAVGRERTREGAVSPFKDTTPGSSFTLTIGSLSFPFPLSLPVGRTRCRFDCSTASGGESSAWKDVARETMGSSESRGRRAGSKSDRTCDDEAVASGGTMIWSEGGATTARLRAEARWDLLLSTLLTGTIVCARMPRGTDRVSIYGCARGSGPM